MQLTTHEDCFCCGRPEQQRMDLDLHWDEGHQRITGPVTFGVHTQGPPGHVHGGSLTTVLDEAMGASAWMSGHPALAVSLNVKFCKLVRMRSRLQVEARVDRIEGRKVYTQGWLRDEKGTVVTEATGLFIQVPTEKVHAQLNELEAEQLMSLWGRQNRAAS